MANWEEQCGNDAGDVALVFGPQDKPKPVPELWGSKDESSVFAIADNIEEQRGANSGDPNGQGGVFGIFKRKKPVIPEAWGSKDESSVFALGKVPGTRRQQCEEGTPGYLCAINDNIEETQGANSGDPAHGGGIYATPNISFANPIITQGDVLSFTLSGFTPGQDLIAEIPGRGSISFTADSNGNASQGFVDSDPPGNYLLDIEDSFGNILWWAKFTVVAPAAASTPPQNPTLIVNPESITQGQAVQCNFTGFTPNYTITVSVVGGQAATAASNVKADKSGSGSTNITVNDTGYLTLQAADIAGNIATASFYSAPSSAPVYVPPVYTGPGYVVTPQPVTPTNPPAGTGITTTQKIVLGGGAVVLLVAAIATSWKKK